MSKGSKRRLALYPMTKWQNDGKQPSRIRGRKLQEIRQRHFQEHPLCVMCQAKGYIRAATELDHIIPLFKGGKDEPANRQGLCTPCHKIKTQQDKSTKAGCDERGYPPAWQ